MARRILNEVAAAKPILGDAIGLAAICVMVLVGLTLPGLG